jgi:hypothetical protein
MLPRGSAFLPKLTRSASASMRSIPIFKVVKAAHGFKIVHAANLFLGPPFSARPNMPLNEHTLFFPGIVKLVLELTDVIPGTVLTMSSCASSSCLDGFRHIGKPAFFSQGLPGQVIPALVNRQTGHFLPIRFAVFHLVQTGAAVFSGRPVTPAQAALISTGCLPFPESSS